MGHTESPAHAPVALSRNVAALAGREFDVLVVGGGINGTGVARDAARRGMSVALVEKEDFGYGTTGRSTRLIHGGLRYLEMYDFGLVRESLRERKRLLRNAPHLVRPLPFLFPIFAGGVSKTKIRLGLTLYDTLAVDSDVPGHRWIPREELLAREPGLAAEGLVGAFEYHDSQVAAVERLCVENALDAAAHGAVLANHAEVEAFLFDGPRVAGARVLDRRTGRALDVRARMTFNASGPWLSLLDVGARNGNPRLRLTKGIHLVVPPVVRNALVLRSPRDNRTFFAIPWNGCTLIGTTDTDWRGDLDDVVAEAEEVRYLAESARAFLPGADLSRVIYTTAGVRPLLHVEGVSESEVSRKHYVLDHEKTEGVPGVVTLVGGKITPFRGVCEEVTTLIARKLGHRAADGKRAKSDTRRAPLPGAAFEDLPRLEAEAARDRAAAGVDEEAARHLAGLYGSRCRDVIALARGDGALARRLCGHGLTIAAEVAFAADAEMAVTVADALLRRTLAGWAPCEARDGALDLAIGVMAARFGWDAGEREDQRAAYVAEVAKRHRFEAPSLAATARGTPDGARA